MRLKLQLLSQQRRPKPIPNQKVMVPLLMLKTSNKKTKPMTFKLKSQRQLRVPPIPKMMLVCLTTRKALITLWLPLKSPNLSLRKKSRLSQVNTSS